MLINALLRLLASIKTRLDYIVCKKGVQKYAHLSSYNGYPFFILLENYLQKDHNKHHPQHWFYMIPNNLLL